MTLQKLYTELCATGFPVTYYEWKSGKIPKPPFIAYFVTRSANFSADNHAYVKGEMVRVELYTTKKDLKAEQATENIFGKLGIEFEKTEEFLQEIDMFLICYDIEIFIES